MTAPLLLTHDRFVAEDATIMVDLGWGFSVHNVRVWSFERFAGVMLATELHRYADKLEGFSRGWIPKMPEFPKITRLSQEDAKLWASYLPW